ncbi:MAG: glycosyltransferase [Acidobacteriota bacterium]
MNPANASGGTHGGRDHRRRPRVVMLLANPFTHDTRVNKQARALVTWACDVTIVARDGKELPAFETRDQIDIERVPFAEASLVDSFRLLNLVAVGAQDRVARILGSQEPARLKERPLLRSRLSWVGLPSLLVVFFFGALVALAQGSFRLLRALMRGGVAAMRAVGRAFLDGFRLAARLPGTLVRSAFRGGLVLLRGTRSIAALFVHGVAAVARFAGRAASVALPSAVYQPLAKRLFASARTLRNAVRWRWNRFEQFFRGRARVGAGGARSGTSRFQRFVQSLRRSLERRRVLLRSRWIRWSTPKKRAVNRRKTLLRSAARKRVRALLPAQAPILAMNLPFARHALRYEPEIVVAHDLNTLLAGLALKETLGCKLVYDSHELYLERNIGDRNRFKENLFWTPLERMAIGQCDAVLSVADGICKHLGDLYRIEKPHLIRNVQPYEPPAFRSDLLAQSLGVSPSLPLGIYAGAITINRGIEQLIEAARYLEDAAFVVMGYALNPAFLEGLQQQARDAGVLGKTLFFHDAVPMDRVVEYVSSAKLSVVPTRNVCLSYYFEASNKIFHSLMAGVPVAMSDHPEKRLLVEEHDVGVLFDENDPKAIAGAVQGLLADDASYARKRQNCLDAARSLNWENEEFKLRKVYAGLLGDRAPRVPPATLPSTELEAQRPGRRQRRRSGGLNPSYVDYLEHFGRTVTLAELHDSDEPGIGLRHDVDHDLDAALDMAYVEQRRGCRATYFLLHTAPYWEDPRFESKCRQLLDYGHEIGLHVDVFSELAENPDFEPRARLEELIDRLRGFGATVRGVAAHGSPQCYELGFINHWFWEELRGDHPEQTESVLNAEGISAVDPNYRVPYPLSGSVEVAEGKRVHLWSVSMSSLGVSYEAARIPVDEYWTDTGGDWKRSGDPLEADLTRGRHQVLFHPVWWRGTARKIFVLSTARSGSKWLTAAIDRATSARAVHEWTLNHHERDGVVEQDKRTTVFQDLLDQRPLALARLREGLRLQRAQGGTVVEANVYLPFFLDELLQMENEAEIVHLYRDGREVVRSLVERGWYSTPDDRNHPRIDTAHWESLGQVERCAAYIRWVHEEIAPRATARLQFERMIQDADYLARVLEDLGLFVHRRLLDEEFGEVLDSTGRWTVPPFDEWRPSLQREFFDTCGPAQRALGYFSEDSGELALRPALSEPLESRQVLSLETFDWSRCGGRGVAVTEAESGVEFALEGPSGPRHQMLAPGGWHNVAREEGLELEPGYYYVGRMLGAVRDGDSVRVFALFYDEEGSLVRRTLVHTWRSEATAAFFSFSGALGATHCALAFHFGDQSAGPVSTLTELEIHRRCFPSGYQFDVEEQVATGAAL